MYEDDNKGRKKWIIILILAVIGFGVSIGFVGWYLMQRRAERGLGDDLLAQLLHGFISHVVNRLAHIYFFLPGVKFEPGPGDRVDEAGRLRVHAPETVILVHDLVQLLFVFLVLDIFEQRPDICPEPGKVSRSGS